jgi:small subunit ribosomal protein S17
MIENEENPPAEPDDVSDSETAAADQSDTVVSDAEETASAPAATPEPPAAEPAVELSPKERRSQKRAASRGTEARPARTQDERTAARLKKRKDNADERRRYRSTSREKRRAGGGAEGTPPAERTGTGSPRVLRGTVVSDKADKTITVRIDVARQHRTYGKIVRTSSKLSAHDERNEANAGDTVRVVESRPLSRSKRWRLVEVVERAR